MSTNEARDISPQVSEIMARVPPEVRDTLSGEQLDALRAAIGEVRPWRKHPIDIRFTFPMGANRAYFTLVAGTNQRNTERRQQDRQAHPLRTASNMVFLGAAVVGLYSVAGVIALVIAAAVRG